MAKRRKKYTSEERRDYHRRRVKDSKLTQGQRMYSEAWLESYEESERGLDYDVARSAYYANGSIAASEKRDLGIDELIRYKGAIAGARAKVFPDLGKGVLPLDKNADPEAQYLYHFDRDGDKRATKGQRTYSGAWLVGFSSEPSKDRLYAYKESFYGEKIDTVATRTDLDPEYELKLTAEIDGLEARISAEERRKAGEKFLLGHEEVLAFEGYCDFFASPERREAKAKFLESRGFTKADLERMKKEREAKDKKI